MKTSAVAAFLAATGVAALVAAENCDLSAIQGSLYPNATQGLADCANSTGVDIFAISEFPTEEQAEAVFQDRDCVDYYNQINQVANSEIYCTITVSGTEVVFAELITSLLTGHTGNESESDSGSVEFPSDSDSGSSDAGDASGSTSDADASSSEASSTSSKSSSNGAVSTGAYSLVVAGAATLIAAALH